MSYLEGRAFANSDEEFRTLVNSDESWFVRSLDDLNTHRSNPQSPLSELDEDAFHAFAQSLHFHDGGVGGGTYKPLMTLPLSKIFEIFNAFGISRDLFLRMHEAKCEGGDCHFSFWDFCSSLCIHTEPASEF